MKVNMGIFLCVTQQCNRLRPVTHLLLLRFSRITLKMSCMNRRFCILYLCSWLMLQNDAAVVGNVPEFHAAEH